MESHYKFLDGINSPADLKKLNLTELKVLVDEIRDYLVDTISKIGGHLGGRDHTTVMHACSKITGLQQSNERIQSQLTEITKRITK
jgi:deoxyxylulose-5-phosphate synthase